MLQRKFQQREELRSLSQGYHPFVDIRELPSGIRSSDFLGFEENDDGDILQGDASRDD